MLSQGDNSYVSQGYRYVQCIVKFMPPKPKLTDTNYGHYTINLYPKPKYTYIETTMNLFHNSC
jgi:hypothetical protein